MPEFNFDAHKQAIEQQLTRDLYHQTNTHAEYYYNLPGEDSNTNTISFDHSDDHNDDELFVRLDNENHPEENDTPATYKKYRVRVVLEPAD